MAIENLVALWVYSHCFLTLFDNFLFIFQFDFDDVLAEPSASQGFDGMWKLSFILFTRTKLWFYRLFAAVLAIPAALVWGLVFSLLSVLYIWILAPVLRLFDLGVAIVRRVTICCSTIEHY